MQKRSLLAVAVAGASVIGIAGTATASAHGNGWGYGRPAPTLNRVAQGDITKQGGARREPWDQTAVIQSAIKKAGAKNVILIIGDGMGDSEITIGRDYTMGAGGAYKGLDSLPLTGQMTHYSVFKDGKPDYVGDSAATGTAWAIGTKTYDNAISVDVRGKGYETLLQKAKRAGMATGDVSTSEIQDATPAVQVANISARKCYGPVATTKSCPEAAKENGGKGSISEQLLDTRPDVTIGGGSKTFLETATAGAYKGRTLEAQAKARGYNYVTTKADLAKVTQADQRKPLLALVSPGNLPTMYGPALATKGGADNPAVRCAVDPAWNNVPSLEDMTKKSINLLSQNRAGKKNGFFLQVESASIDKKDHAADACGQIGETDQLDKAVSAALDYARKDGNTLVIVTADHAHTSQIVDEPNPDTLSIKLRTNEGSDLTVAYGTAPQGGSQQHTGAQVRVAAYGPGAANVVGLIDQTDLHFIMKNAMRLS